MTRRMMTPRERAYAEICARDMHPDLFAGIEESQEAKDLRERFGIADQIEDLRRLFLTDGFPIGYNPIGTASYINVTQYNYAPEFKDSSYVDAEATLRELRRVTQILRNAGAKIGKEFTDSSITVKATLKSGLTITVSANRGAVCERKVVGQEWVEPVKGHYRDIVEWDCQPVSILKSGEV